MPEAPHGSSCSGCVSFRTHLLLSTCVCTRSQLQAFARGRDHRLAAEFRAKLKRLKISADMILAIDETSKDSRALQRSFGYSLRGEPAIGGDSLRPRGDRVSALTSLSTKGFVAWECTSNTFNRESFLALHARVLW